MRMTAFAGRNQKELLRDPFSLIFGIGLPLVLMGLMTLIQRNVPVQIFAIESLAPGLAVFSFSFISLFTGMLIGRDRSTSFLTRLFASPLSSADYLLGYSLPLIPITILQSVVLFGAALLLFGLAFSVNVLLAILICIPIGFLFIGMGLLVGSLFTDRQAGGIFTILVQVISLSSGMWFDLDMIGGSLKTICYAMPFAHAVDAVKLALTGNMAATLPHLLWVLGYALVAFVAAVLVFRKRMKA